MRQLIIERSAKSGPQGPKVFQPVLFYCKSLQITWTDQIIFSADSGGLPLLLQSLDYFALALSFDSFSAPEVWMDVTGSRGWVGGRGQVAVAGGCPSSALALKQLATTVISRQMAQSSAELSWVLVCSGDWRVVTGLATVSLSLVSRGSSTLRTAGS